MHHRASIARRSSSFDAPFCTHCVESPQGFSPFAARVVAPRRPVPPRLFRVVALSFTTVRAFALIAALILRSNPVVVVVVVVVLVVVVVNFTALPAATLPRADGRRKRLRHLDRV